MWRRPARNSGNDFRFPILGRGWQAWRIPAQAELSGVRKQFSGFRVLFSDNRAQQSSNYFLRSGFCIPLSGNRVQLNSKNVQ